MKSFDPVSNVISEDGEVIATYDPLTFSVEAPKALHHKTQTAITKLLEDDFALEVRDFITEKVELTDTTTPTLEQVTKARDILSGSKIPQGGRMMWDGEKIIGDIPPCPPSHPAMGDKTPEVIEWHRQYSTPEDFERKYRNRVLPDYDDTLENAERGLPDDEDEENNEPPKVIS